MPKVSVIIPNYNHGPYLGKRIESVLGQTFTDFEVLYLDDASTDDSNEIVTRYLGDNRVRTFTNEVNSGNPFKQWNQGVKLASGEYVWIAEADDYADERLLARLVEKLDANPDVGLAYCQSIRVDAEDNRFESEHDFLRGEGRWGKDFIGNGKEECRLFLASRNPIPNASAVLFRRRVYEDAGFADETMRLCGDWQMWVKLLLKSDIAFVAEPLNYFRSHPASVGGREAHTGRYHEEAYRVFRHVLNNLDLPSDTKEQGCQAIMGAWVDAALSKQRDISWSTNRRIYRLAREVDARLKPRLAKALLFALLQKTIFFAPVTALLQIRKRRSVLTSN